MILSKFLEERSAPSGYESSYRALIDCVKRFDFKNALNNSAFSYINPEAKDLIKKYSEDPIEMERYRLERCAEDLEQLDKRRKTLIEQTIKSKEIVDNMTMPNCLRVGLMQLEATDDALITIKETARKKEWTYADKQAMAARITGMHEIPEIYALATWCLKTPSQVEKEIEDDRKKLVEAEDKVVILKRIISDNTSALEYMR